MTSPPRSALERLTSVKPGGHVVTIGNFDGVHRGHKYLLSTVVEYARQWNLSSLAITFEPHPVSVFRPEKPFPRLASPALKLELLAAQGIDEVAVIPFDLDFASLTPDEFLQLLRETTSPRVIVVGEGFRFGKDRAGSDDTIRGFGAAHGIDVAILDRLRDEDAIISSSAIRHSLQQGNVRDAKLGLGRRYRLTGTVEHGLERGRDLGYPTANLIIHDSQCIPANGIYAAFTRVGDNPAPLPAMVYIGTSATFGPRERTVEVNILDFNADIYASEIELEFVHYMRGDVRFESAEGLIQQMRQDEQSSRRLLKDEIPQMGRQN